MKATLSPTLDLAASPATDALTASLLSRPAEKGIQDAASSRLPAVIMGRVTGFDSSGTPLVDFAENSSGVALPANSLVAIEAADAGAEVALVFEGGNARRPVILGKLATKPPVAAPSAGSPIQVNVDGEQVTVSAKNEIVLRCGKASITLTRAGKVLIRGAYLLSRSSGVNRIKGGSVQIN